MDQDIDLLPIQCSSSRNIFFYRSTRHPFNYVFFLKFLYQFITIGQESRAKGCHYGDARGEAMPRIPAQVIRFCINSNDKQLKSFACCTGKSFLKYQEPTSDQLLAEASGGATVQRKMLPEMLWSVTLRTI
jgi:hypothetical protein